MKMNRITELYLERVFRDMRQEDMLVIKRNLKRLMRPELVETLLTNTVNNVWISADSLSEFISGATNDTFEKVYSVANVKSDNKDNTDEYCFKVNIDDYGDLTITIECDVEGLTWTSKDYIDYMVERGGFMRHSESKRTERYNIPFRHKIRFSRTVSLDSIRKYVLASE